MFSKAVLKIIDQVADPVKLGIIADTVNELMEDSYDYTNRDDTH